ncbi:UDP-N-acetylglucosamine 2-epimerase [Aliidiomarina maris]|uniref:UDP-N-acetylglucosamine 2-epimerase (Hydrolyzing) n=1 Tax=Aliidiomarina maris TaxID=531312 RepID=A0A327X2F8_9GAMM|nr:UDP-N-acetylglucosamine 2-epimerase [Aliidiomarina maris]RAK00731.1 UDP-N-acetylglucosamine 2-epimerase (non-hydrolysing) [Aliidiomarina maris]RUO27270.1 UDP-N-acetylglucosamine 2-epimerase (hydrolyzing) [Aliidiomarina maris]
MNPRKIGVFTATRAEYGLLYWTLKAIQQAPDLTLQLFVSGTHLVPEFGFTAKEIEKDGFVIDETIEMLLASDSAAATVKSSALGMIGFADALARQQPDVMIILGDRYEALSMAQASVMMHIPILHVHGGEITEGAYDNEFRHAITKLSHLHAASTERYCQRIIQMGEMPERVHHVGSLGVEHLHKVQLLTRDELIAALNFELGEDYVVLAYHPETHGELDGVEVLDNIFQALNHYPELRVLMTFPNADSGGRALIQRMQTQAGLYPERFYVTSSLGQLRFLSALKHAQVMIGNSSSGIIEAPSVGTATVNIGNRQAGRIAAQSVFHSETSISAIKTSIDQALTFSSSMSEPIHNPYDAGCASEKMLNILRKPLVSKYKKFYDIN